MKEERMKWLMKEHVDKIDDEVECVSSVMHNIKNNRRQKPYILRIQRPIFIILAILILSTVAYAASNQIIELRNKDNQVAGTVEIKDDGTNYPLQSHLDNKDLFTHEVNRSQYKEAILVIDTDGVYPSNIDLRLETDSYDTYDTLKKSNAEVLLPERIGDFVFDRAWISYEAKRPTEEEVNKYIKENAGQERFISISIPSGNARSIYYSYKEKGSNIIYDLNINLVDENTFVTWNPIDEHDIISLNGTDAFLYKCEVSGVQYGANGETGIITSENLYRLLWYNTELSIGLSCRPGTPMSTNGPVETKEDGTNVYLEIYPEDTKEMITLFAGQIASYLDSIAE